MTQQHHDPAVQWAGHLGRLVGVRREAVVAALRHSADAGWPASSQAVELLVSYALSEITAREYADGILTELSGQEGQIAALDPPPTAPSAYVAGEVDAVPATTQHRAPTPRPPAQDPAPVLSREDAVQAYVTGQIPVEEFLRLARE